MSRQTTASVGGLAAQPQAPTTARAKTKAKTKAKAKAKPNPMPMAKNTLRNKAHAMITVLVRRAAKKSIGFGMSNRTRKF